MIDDGLINRFGIEEVYGMHNYPGMPVGQFAIRPGPMMAAADTSRIDIEGIGGHAARPHLAIDTVAGRGADRSTSCNRSWRATSIRCKSAVVSICMLQAGHTDNVIPQPCELARHRAQPAAGGPRAAAEADRARWSRARRGVRRQGEDHLHDRLSGRWSITSGRPRSPPSVAREIAGKDKVNTDVPPMMGAEDFAFMLNERPGAFICVGNGDSAGCTTRPTISTTRRSRSARHTGCELAETALAG